MKRQVVTLLLKVADASVFLAVVGILGVAAAVARWFQIIPAEPLLVSLLTFSFVSVLCTTVVVGFLKLNTTVEAIKNHIDEAVTCTHAEGPVVWDSLGELVSEGRKRIRATHFGVPEANDLYVQRLIAKLVTQPGLVYQVIIGYQSGAPGPAIEITRARRRRFTDAGVSEQQIDFRYMPTQWGMDLLIIDDDHLFVGLPTNPRHDDQIRCGLVFRGKRDVVDNFRQWYDEYLWARAEKEPNATH